MHKLLKRQIKRFLNVGDKACLTLASQASDPPDAAEEKVLASLPTLLAHISNAYEQHERDLALMRNSLEISSRELTDANEKLRTEAAEKARALESIQTAINRLVTSRERGIDHESSMDKMAGKLVQVARERESMQKALAEEHERAVVTLASIGDGVLVTDTHGYVTFLNEEATRLTCVTSAEAEGVYATEVATLLDEGTGQPLTEHPIVQCRKEKKVVGSTGPALLLTQNGHRIPVEHTTSPIILGDGRLTGMVMILRDVSKSREIAQKMSWQASHDALTGLWSRTEFERRLDLLIHDAHAGNTTHALLYLDLDQFKLVNDTCGHAAGDELLKQLSFLLQNRLRQSDLLARLGGDEFGVLLHGCSRDAAIHIAGQLRTAVCDSRFGWEKHIFDVGVSIGLVMIDSYIEGSSVALRQADIACYAAKDLGRNRIHVFQANDEELSRRHNEMQWAARISEALATNRFRLYAQEIRPLGKDKSAHLEILLRMIDESGQEIPPGAFIPAAERYSLMGKIDRWVIEHTLEALDASDYRKGEVQLAINLSALSLMDSKLVEMLRQQMQKWRISPEALCFEVTETAAISHLATAVQLIQEIKSLGCMFALDDFGSGMSSFAYLKNLPVDYLKIDGAFVRDIVTDPIDRAFVEAIDRIGKVMGKETIAEFVENRDIMNILGEIGVDYAQGYGVSRPMPLEDWLNTLAFDGMQRPAAA